MAKENENQSLREYGNRKKRYKRSRNIIILTLLLAVVIVGFIYIVSLYNKTYKSYKVVKSTEITGKSAAGYLTSDGYLVKYGKDGAIAYNKDGKQVWNGSFNMSDPITDTCGKYVVIADRGGKSIHIFNDKGKVGDYSTDYKITKVEIASQGVVAVLMEEGSDNYIKIYDMDGTELAGFSRSVSKIGYPLDMTLSNDGQKLVLSSLTVNKGELVSNVGCYNFGDVGDSYINQYVGGYSFKVGIVAPKVAFLNNDTFCAFKDNGFVVYTMRELPDDIKEVNLEGKIQSILYNKNSIGVVIQEKNGAAKQLQLYNLKGKLILDKPIDFAYKRIYMTDQEIIMYNDLNCMIMKMSGKQKFNSTFKTQISAFYPINNMDHYFMVDETKLMDIQLKD